MPGSTDPTVADVVYGAADGRDLHADVFLAAGENRHAVVLQLHGGGWRAGSRAGVHSRCHELAQHGFTCLAVEYRLLTEAPWPAPLADVQQAVRWAAARAPDWDADPARLVLQGYSAGAHLALLAATAAHRDGQPAVAAVVAAYPATDFHPTGPDEVGVRPAEPGETLPGWLLFDRATTDDELRAVSPARLLDPGFPPTLLLHGTSDRIRPHPSSVALHAQLLAQGVPADLRLYAGQDHEFDYVPAFRAAVARDIAFFLRRMVTDREAIAADVEANSIFARRRGPEAARR
jgi:acetyl esterase/lipase